MVQTALFKPTYLDPPLKWAGGKRWLAPIIHQRFWAKHKRRRLIEPFVGGMALALELMPEKAHLNDINPHLVNFYHHLKQGLDPSEIEMANDKELYYTHRGRFNELIATNQHSSSEAALLFYYLNRTGFNGLCRFNSQGFFNVPFGRHSTITYAKNFEPYAAVLSEWTFTVGDFTNLDIKAGDFVYADPPYDVEFTKYSPEDFTWADQLRLAKWLAELDVPVLLSNQATERILSLYGDLGFTVEVVSAPRRISRTGDRTPANEVLAYKGM